MAHQADKPTQPATDRTQRDLFAWSLLAALLLTAALAGPFFAGRVYTRDDLGAFHLPTRAFYARQLSLGEPFDWMPHLYCGFYLTGEGQAGTYHPIHWLLYRCLPFRSALGWELLLPYPAMLAGTWLFLSRRLHRPDAAMLGSLIFTFSTFNLLHFIHPNAVAVIAHIPWLLWAIDLVVLDRRRSAAALAQAAIALLTASQLLLGYPQYVWFSLLAEAAYAAFILLVKDPSASKDQPSGTRDRASGTWDRASGTWNRASGGWGPAERAPGIGPISRCLPLLIAKGCGLLLGGVQLLPTIDALAHSTRQFAGPNLTNIGSLDPLNLAQLLAPYMFSTRVAGQNTHELGLYAGAVPLMLIAYLIARRRKLAALRPLAWGAGALALFALLLALGRHGPLYRLQSYLPLVGRFRFPCRYLVLMHLAVAVLCGIGFILLVRDHQRSHGAQATPPRPRTPRTSLRPLWALVALSAVLAEFGLIFQDRSWMAPIPAVLTGPLLMATAAGLVALAATGRRWALVGLILFTALDLGTYGLTYAVYPQYATLEQFIASADSPPGDPQGRVLASSAPLDDATLRTGNQMVLSGWRRADGYAGLEPHRRLDYSQPAALRTAGVRWVMQTPAGRQIEGLIPHGPQWLEVPAPLPRVRLVAQTQLSHDPAHDLQQIALESAALTEVPLELPPAQPGTATLLDDRPGRLQVCCDCRTPQLLIVSESFHPGWEARVDGRGQQVLRVNGDQMGCLVGPGKQGVVLEFRPESLRRGWIASCCGLVLVVCCLVAGVQQPQAIGPLSTAEHKGWQ